MRQACEPWGRHFTSSDRCAGYRRVIASFWLVGAAPCLIRGLGRSAPGGTVEMEAGARIKMSCRVLSACRLGTSMKDKACRSG